MEWPFIYPELRPTPPDWEEEFIRKTQVVQFTHEHQTITVDLKAKITMLGRHDVSSVNGESHITESMRQELFEIGVRDCTLERLRRNKPMEFVQECDQICDELENLIGDRWKSIRVYRGPDQFIDSSLHPKEFTTRFRHVAYQFRMAIEFVKRGLPLIEAHMGHMLLSSPICELKKLRYVTKGTGIHQDWMHSTFAFHHWKRDHVRQVRYQEQKAKVLLVLSSFDVLSSYFPEDIARMMVLYMYPTDELSKCSICRPAGYTNVGF
jgi:hypothetical protein